MSGELLNRDRGRLVPDDFLPFYPARLEAAAMQAMGNIELGQAAEQRIGLLLSQTSTADSWIARLNEDGGSIDAFGKLVARISHDAAFLLHELERIIERG